MKKRVVWAVLTVAVILLSSCGRKVPPAANPPVNPTFAAAPQTSAAETSTPPQPSMPVPNPVPSLPPVTTTSLPPSIIPPATPAASTTQTPPPIVLGFSSGIYYRAPHTGDPGGNLTMIDGDLPAFAGITLPPTYFTMTADKLVLTDNQDTVLIYTPDGKLQTVKIAGLYQMGRPSLSPDGKMIAVQAAEIANPQPQDLNIYVVDLNTGKWERISGLLDTPEEAPRWFPKSNLVAYTSFSSEGTPEQGLVIHIYDVDAQKEVRQITGAGGAGGLNLAVSPDEKTVLNSNTMTLYDVQTGAMVSQLRTKIAQALQYLGLQEDTRFPGQANRGTLTLHGNFSPDGKSIVIDGAALKNGAYGVYIARVAIAGDAVSVKPLLDLVPNDPAYSNNNNYSQTSPFWLP